jgi:hypothetical protein
MFTLPYAVWIFQSEIQTTKIPKAAWNPVTLNFGEPGGGNEATIGQPFPVKSAFLLGN